jgi:hypothetical protein
MIHPDTRSMLTDALTPPAGYSFTGGIITTYSLDLVTLLTLPLHLSWLSSPTDGPENLDPLRILESLRRSAERLTIFCERGRLLIPRSSSPLLSLLEDMVHETTAPHGGAFHPKVWLLRFASEENSHDVALRLLVMSRNLTDDCSWDLCLQLEGSPGKGNKLINRPLTQFIQLLINATPKSASPARQEHWQALLEDVSNCAWIMPGDFDELAFHTLGLGKQPTRWLPDSGPGGWDELGVISPFVSDSALATLAENCTAPLFVISRAEEINRLQQAIPFASCWVLYEGIEEESIDASQPDSLVGLHAKAFIGRKANRTHLFLGSANATNAALLRGNNVEFLVELVGKPGKVGKPADWITEKCDGLAGMIQPFTPEPEAQSNHNSAEEQLEALRQQISHCSLSLHCEPHDALWQLQLHGLQIVVPEHCHIEIWPLTLPQDRATPISISSDGAPIRLHDMARQDITSFTGFALHMDDVTVRFGLDIPLHNAPAGRDTDILRMVIRNREAFVRYIMLLLGELLGSHAEDDISESASGFSWSSLASTEEPPLFELLATTYAREPQQLQHVANALLRLQSATSDTGEPIIPPGFLQIWESFAEAMAKDRQP